MKFIRKYWLIEATLLLIAIAGFGTAAYNVVTADAQPTQAEVVTAEDEMSVLNPAEISSGTLEEEVNLAQFDEDFFEDEDEEEPVNESDSDDEEDESDDPEEDDAFDEREDDESDETLDDQEEGEDGEDATFNDIASLMGLDADALDEALSEGKTLAAVAEENGVAVQQVVDLLVAAELKILEAEAAAGEIDAEEIDDFRQNGAAFIAFEISTPYQNPAAVTAEQIGLDEGEIWEALESGQSIEAVVNQNNADLQSIIEAILQAETTYIDAMLTAGLIDRDERDEWVAELANEIPEWVRTTEID